MRLLEICRGFARRNHDLLSLQLGKLHDGDIHRRRGGIVSRVIEAQRAMYKTRIDQTRKTPAAMAKKASTKATMEF